MLRRSIEPDEEQPRTRFDPEKIKELRESIEHQGQLMPITVKPLGDGKFRILEGHRRWYSMEGFDLIDAIVVTSKLTEEQIRARQLAENIQREDLSLADICRQIVKFNKEFKRSYEYLAKNDFRPLAKGNPEWVGDRARAWNRADDETRELMERYKDVFSHVEVIVTVDDATLRHRMISRVRQGATVAEIKLMLPRKPEPAPTSRGNFISVSRRPAAPTDYTPTTAEDLEALDTSDEDEEEERRKLEEFHASFDFPEEPEWTAESVSMSFQSTLRTLQNAHAKIATAKQRTDFTPLARQGWLTSLKLIQEEVKRLEALASD